LNGNGQKKILGIVFDFDGTLAELHLDFTEMKRRLSMLVREYRAFSATPPPRMPALEWIESLAADMSKVDPEACGDFQKSAHALILDMELEAARKGRLFAFSRSILEELKRDSIQTAIITRNCEQAVRIVFPDLEDYCLSFLSRDHVPHVKPDPDHLLRALRSISVEPSSALMVGDHPIDIQTGKRAGVMTAGVCSGNASRKDLIQSGARWTAHDCYELLRELKDQSLI